MFSRSIRFPPSNFYPRPCGRGDQRAHERRQARFISTHAPVGGRRDIVAATQQIKVISTHAPAGEATRQCKQNKIDLILFLLTSL